MYLLNCFVTNHEAFLDTDLSSSKYFSAKQLKIHKLYAFSDFQNITVNFSFNAYILICIQSRFFLNLPPFSTRLPQILHKVVNTSVRRGTCSFFIPLKGPLLTKHLLANYQYRRRKSRAATRSRHLPA